MQILKQVVAEMSWLVNSFLHLYVPQQQRN
jgi:hypothetical protein